MIIVVTSVSVLLICLCGGLIYRIYVKRTTESVSVEMVRFESNFKGKAPPPFKVQNICEFQNIYIYNCAHWFICVCVCVCVAIECSIGKRG